MSQPIEGKIRVCPADRPVCPNCDQALMRNRLLAGHAFDQCDRKLLNSRIAGTRCNTHLYLTRGRGEPYVLVMALRNAYDRDRLIALLDPPEQLSSAS